MSCKYLWGAGQVIVLLAEITAKAWLAGWYYNQRKKEETQRL